MEIRTIEDTLRQFKHESEKGTVVKHSKDGAEFKFHDFWLRVRCPALIHFNTKVLSTEELSRLHHIIYSLQEESCQASAQRSNENEDTLATQNKEKSFVFSSRLTETTASINPNQTKPANVNQSKVNDNESLSEPQSFVFTNSVAEKPLPSFPKTAGSQNNSFVFRARQSTMKDTVEKVDLTLDESNNSENLFDNSDKAGSYIFSPGLECNSGLF